MMRPGKLPDGPRTRLYSPLQRAYIRLSVGSAHNAWAVILTFMAFAAISVWLVIMGLRIDTDPNRMIAEDLPFRQAYFDLLKTFPELDNTFIFIVDAEEPERGREAARALTQSFAARPDLFQDVHAPGASRYFDTYGILYLGPETVTRLADEIERAGPMIKALANSPNMAGLSRLVRRMARGANRGLVPPAVGKFFEEAALTVDGQTSGRSRHLAWDNLGGGGAELTQKRWYVVVKPKLDYKALDPAAASLAEARRIVSDPEVTQGGRVSVRLTGEAAMNAEEFEAVTSGAAVAGIASLTLVCIVIFFGLPALRYIIPTLALILLGFLINAGFATLAIGELNMISVAFAVLFIGLGVDYAVHVILRYAELLDMGHHKIAAITETAARIGPALGLCTITTATAFLAFTPTDFVGMSQLGIIAAGGIVIAFFASLTLVPAVLFVMAKPPRKRRTRRGMSHWAGIVIGYIRMPVAMLVLFAAAAAISVLPQARFDGDPVNLKDPKSKAVIEFKELLRTEPGHTYAAQVLVANEAAADRLAGVLQTLPEVAEVRTVRDFLPDNQDRKLIVLKPLGSLVPDSGKPARDIGDKGRAKGLKSLKTNLSRIVRANGASDDVRQKARALLDALTRFENAAGARPDNLKQLETALFAKLPELLGRLRILSTMQPITVETLDEGLSGRYIGPGGRWRVEVLPKGDLRDEQTMHRFAKAVQSVAANATGAPVEISGGADVVATAMAIACFAAIGLVLIILMVLLRRVVDVLLVLAPIVLSAILLVAYTVLADSPFNFANVIVLPLLLGLGIDSAIHYVMRAREDVSIDVAGTSTPRAVMISAFTTIGSFGTLWLSPHRGMASMGELLTVAILITLVCTLLVLPQLITWTIGRGRT